MTETDLSEARLVALREFCSFKDTRTDLKEQAAMAMAISGYVPAMLDEIERWRGKRPRIVCLCGSTRFGEAFRKAQVEETLAGRIVLTIGCLWHSDEALGLTSADKERLDGLHLRKIELADEVLILNVGGYIGESTSRELAHARKLGKVVRFLEAERTDTK